MLERSDRRYRMLVPGTLLACSIDFQFQEIAELEA
jgi:hypothetical protein